MQLKMNLQEISKKKVIISRTTTVIVFLALIRCVSESFRLNYYSTYNLTFLELKPFLIGALTTAIALFIMTIFSFYGKHKIIIFILQ